MHFQLNKSIEAAACIATTALFLFANAAFSATPFTTADLSPDVTVTLSGSTYFDHDVSVDDLSGGPPSIDDLGVLPSGVDVVAFHLDLNGDALFVLSPSAALSGGVVAQPGDVIRWDGVAYAVEFDASLAGIPDGVNVDALSHDATDLLLSFDVTVALGGMTANDEDLVAWDGAAFTLFFDASAAGLSKQLDLNGAHYFIQSGHLALSFDGSGSVGLVDFDDEDVLEYDPTSGLFELAWDGSSQHAEWGVVDVDAVHFVPEPSTAGLLISGIGFLASVARRKARPTRRN